MGKKISMRLNGIIDDAVSVEICKLQGVIDDDLQIAIVERTTSEKFRHFTITISKAWN